MKLTRNKVSQWLSKAATFFSLSMLSSVALAKVEGLAPAKGAFEYIVDYSANLTVLAMATFIIFRLWQIQGGQREWTDVIKPIVITALVIGVKVAAPLILSSMGWSDS